jgi:hypothetical protein
MARAFLLVTLVTLVLFGLSGCLAHERVEDVDASALPSDGGLVLLDTAPIALDAAPMLRDAGRCMPAMTSAIRFEPGLPMPATGIRIVWLGYDYDAAEDGARIHLDVCGGAPPCMVDLVVPHVGDALRAIGNGPGIGGTLDTDGSTYAVVHLLDARRCASCGGQLELLAGRLVTGLDTAITVATDAVSCSTGCGELRTTAATAGGTTGVAMRGPPLVGPVLVSIASDYHAPCVVCDCAAADVPATGVIAWSTGIFVPAP